MLQITVARRGGGTSEGMLESKPLKNISEGENLRFNRKIPKLTSTVDTQIIHRLQLVTKE